MTKKRLIFPLDQLINWYNQFRRDLPWRHRQDIYGIWLAEVMLQQTQVSTVIPYYLRFISRFPTLLDLANADYQEVLKLWEGLGYYNRCLHFFQSVQEVVHSYHGEIPGDVDRFGRLPGVGPYIKAAVMSIACGHPLPVVDGNVIRVISRFMAIRDDADNPKTARKIRQRLEKIIPANNPGDFNQALMELGATRCTPQNPRCLDCPLRFSCLARQKGLTQQLPRRKPFKKIPTYRVAVGVIRQKKQILIQQRSASRHLANLWEFPGGKAQENESLEQALIRECREELGIEIKIDRKIKSISHQYTHFKIRLTSYLCQIKNGHPIGLKNQPIKWIDIQDLDQFPFPQANHKFFLELKKIFEH